MARLPVNGASDNADSPLTVEGKRPASPTSVLHTEPALVIEEGFRSLGLTPGTASAILQALINISTNNANTTAAPQTSVENFDIISLSETHGQETALSESDDASDAPDCIPSEAPTTTAASPLLTPAATGAPICIKDAVSTSTARGVLTPVVNPADVQPIVAPPVVTTTAAPAADALVAVPAAHSPVAVPTAAATFTTPAVAAVIATPIFATPIVATPTSTTAPVVTYHLPVAGTPGPYYCVTRRRDIGVFAGW